MKRLALLLLALPALTPAQDAGPVPPDEVAPQPAELQPPPPPPPVARRVIVPEPAPGYRGPQRGSWYIGFGLGSGGGWVTDAGERHSFNAYNYSEDRATFAFDFHVGATLTPRLLVGGELGAIGTAGSQSGYSSSLVTTYVDAVVTFFPVERGFFVRGGTGFSSLGIRQELPGQTLEGDWDGGNLLAGFGYAWWLGRSFNLLGQLDLMKSWYGRSGPDSTDSLAVKLGFGWY